MLVYSTISASCLVEPCCQPLCLGRLGREIPVVAGGWRCAEFDIRIFMLCICVYIYINAVVALELELATGKPKYQAGEEGRDEFRLVIRGIGA